jgi:hypothetical protein
MKDQLYYLVDANVAIPLRNPFRVQTKFVETTNFVPNINPKHSSENAIMKTEAIISQGETWMPELDFLMENDSVSRVKSPFSPSESFLRLVDDADDNDQDEEDWDEDEEDWDEDEEDEDEDWDEDDEDWDEDDEDEDEDWDEDTEEE